MNRQTLEQYFSLNRRYSRSVNVERDLTRLEALKGYVLTERAVDALRRILKGLTTAEANHAWTLTSVYGTGKSAFTHYLTSVCAPAQSQMRSSALEIAQHTLGAESSDYQALTQLPEKGLFRAVATAAREPISHTIVRGLLRGAETFWSSPAKRNKISVVRKLEDLNTEIESGEIIENREIPELVQDVAKAANTGVFLVIDELGKNLEYAAYNQGTEDLYVLQQLAELPGDSQTPIYILGILHQAFAEYGQRLATVQRNEWAKIQGRFEDIPFTESAGQMMRLIEKVINLESPDKIACQVHSYGNEWSEGLATVLTGEELPTDIFKGVYPLHPLSALVLPTLCHRYAQNDRSLFTFLTSAEPYSLRNFLQRVSLDGESFSLATLKLDWIYDYFIEAAGMGLASRPNLQRWVEIQDLIADARYLEPNFIKVLKAIGILNLVTTTGATRATKRLVTLAMCDFPNNQDQIAYWETVIEGLLRRGVITHRRTMDELRIWQGSDFNVDQALSEYLEKDRSSLVNLLSSLRSLPPIVVQRHSYKTGTLRYFERHYLDSTSDLTQLCCDSADADGYVGYWVDDVETRHGASLHAQVPAVTDDGKPLVLLGAAKLDVLRLRSREYAALKAIQDTASELQSDGVARKEVRFRVVQAEQLLDETLAQAFEMTGNDQPCWVQGEAERIGHITDFNAKLSDLCDRVYDQSPILWNELINRRDLTSQGAKARRELITAMVERGSQERLGLEGYGPEVSMYYSLLGETGIHRQEEGEWDFYPPSEGSKVGSFWQAIEEFCLSAKEKPKSLDQIYQRLAAAPYGIKPGAIPVMLAAVLLHHVDDLGVYRDGTYIPILGSEHFELLVKDPSRYAVKYFEVVGLRSQVFKELEAILRQSKLKKGKIRNATLLTVVTPLYQFVNRLPAYTKQTKRISQEAQRVLTALKETTEPDELLFNQLPRSFNLPPIDPSTYLDFARYKSLRVKTEAGDDGTIAKSLRSQLVQVLREINTAYEGLLSECQRLLHNAFGVSSREQKLREELRVRSRPLVGKCVERTLRSFTQAAVDEEKTDREWLAALVMIVADKPAESWTDENVTGFEIKLSDLARRFKNLEALDHETRDQGEGFDARRITVTQPDGKETHR
ncbi:MAG: hypothetical protein ACLFWI_27300, partial [Coleofasciculus sp.]|uniref:hypothetical protein n=1 Tax=Coleofasciculus sp. TaxID=3100458 RepID=UPI003A155778